MSSSKTSSDKVEWSIENKGTFASVTVKLPPKGQVHCESDAIVTMTSNISVEGEMRGGLLAALFRRFLTQETFFTTCAKAKNNQPGNLMLAANEPGDIMLHELQPHEDLLLTRGSYVAADQSVNISTKLQTSMSKAKLSGTGLFLIRAYGSGTIACSAFGAIHKYVLNKGEERVVDNGHLIGWSAHLNYKVGKASSSMTGSLTSGEGIMIHFEGPGTIYVQSHTPKVELLAQAASPRKRKGRMIVAGILFIVVVFAFANAYFFVKQHLNKEQGGGEEQEL